tara:strand:+ start:284 stop:592 length:309 start_codon:yes stop_codon:yes gene_type:complete
MSNNGDLEYELGQEGEIRIDEMVGQGSQLGKYLKDSKPMDANQYQPLRQSMMMQGSEHNSRMMSLNQDTNQIQPSFIDTENNESGVLEILVQLNKRGMECLS